MDLLQLQYFREIARYENMTRAAANLYVTQPNLSASITRLEEDLGVSLFDRRRGRIALTAAGRTFLTYVEEVLDRLDEGVGQVRLGVQQNLDQLRVAGSIDDFIRDMLLQFYPENQDVYIRQINCANADVFQRVADQTVDLGFALGDPPIPGLEYLLLDTCIRVLILHANHPLADAKTISLSDLKGENFICNAGRDDDILFRELSRSRHFQPRIFCECDDTALELGLLTEGRGISIVPVTNYMKLLRQNPELPLRCLRITDELPLVKIGMVRKTGSRLTRSALRFCQHVEAFFKEENRMTREFLSHLSGKGVTESE